MIRVTGDKEVRDQIRLTEDGRLECDFPERMVLIANHQVSGGSVIVGRELESDELIKGV